MTGTSTGMSADRNTDSVERAAVGRTTNNERPNVLLIHCDQLRFDGISCNGSPYAQTPNIDALAAQGVNFTRHVSCNTLCQPSRASLLTGFYPTAHGLWCNGPALLRNDHAPGPAEWTTSIDKGPSNPQPSTMGDIFAAAGYRTAAFGKLHLEPILADGRCGFRESLQHWASGAMDNWSGPYYGFEHAEFCLGHNETQHLRQGHYAQWIRERDPALVDRILADPPKGEYQLWPGPVPHELHHTNWLAERVGAYISERAADGAPFCAFVGFPGPHHPFAPSADILPAFVNRDPGMPSDFQGALLSASRAHGRFVRWPPAADLRDNPEFIATARRYTAAMIHQIDLAVGRILAALDECNLRDNTIIAFTSDHGDYLGDHGLLFKNELASHSLLHIPFLLAGPGLHPGTRDTDVMSNVDVLPTLTSMAGIETPSGIQGIDRGSPGSGQDHAALACCYSPILVHRDRARDNLTIYKGSYRYTAYPRADLDELFDHDDDPAETRDLAGEPSTKDTACRLRGELAERHLRTSMPVGVRPSIF